MVLQRLNEARVPEHEAGLLVCLAAMLGVLDSALVKPHWQQLLPWTMAALRPIGRARPDPAACSLLLPAGGSERALWCAAVRAMLGHNRIKDHQLLWKGKAFAKGRIEMKMTCGWPLTLRAT